MEEKEGEAFHSTSTGSDQPSKQVCADGIFIYNYNATKQLCDLLQVHYPLWASASPSIKEGSWLHSQIESVQRAPPSPLTRLQTSQINPKATDITNQSQGYRHHRSIPACLLQVGGEGVCPQNRKKQKHAFFSVPRNPKHLLLRESQSIWGPRLPIPHLVQRVEISLPRF